jgi:hypothetical protein
MSFSDINQRLNCWQVFGIYSQSYRLDSDRISQDWWHTLLVLVLNPPAVRLLDCLICISVLLSVPLKFSSNCIILTCFDAFLCFQICFLIAQQECRAHLWHVCHPLTFATMGATCWKHTDNIALSCLGLLAPSLLPAPVMKVKINHIEFLGCGPLGCGIIPSCR